MGGQRLPRLLPTRFPHESQAKEGSMADKSTQLILDALSRAVAEPAGMPLHGTKAAPGLFPGTSLGKQAAQRSKDEGFLRVARTETKGKTVQEVCAITDKGLAYLLSQVSPKQVLEDFVRALEARQSQVGDLVATARQTQASFEALRASAEKVLHQVQSAGPGDKTAGPAPADTWTRLVLDHLTRWQEARASEDCSLPELYSKARETAPALTIGNFHDGLRRLYDQEQIFLHPWTGPLYAIPEPPCALLVGHEIAYYASRRCA
jgi:hypothetical protein